MAQWGHKDICSGNALGRVLALMSLLSLWIRGFYFCWGGFYG